MQKIILASSSPYKKELLMRLGIEFEVEDSGLDEDIYKETIKNPTKLTQILAKEKALLLHRKFQKAVIIGADQICLFEGTIMGKTNSLEKSYEQLMKMQGKTHELITSYFIKSPDREVIRTNITKLTLRKLSSAQIKNYLSQDNPIDCAGSYKLELKGIGLMEKIETNDHTAIVGLPLLMIGNDLVDFGFSIPPEN